MSVACRFAYAQARLQARYARLPAESDWKRLEAARDLSTYLEEARDGALRQWVKGFSGRSDSHDLERGLRAQFTDTVLDVARFVPSPWRGALEWCRWLPLLGLFEHLRRGGTMPTWAAAGYRLRDLLSDDGDFDNAALRRAGLVPLVRTEVESNRRGTACAWAWQIQWRERWPPCRPELLRNMDELADLIAGHLDGFRGATPDDAWSLRESLRARLRMLFHLRLLQPAAAFIFIGLTALDLERLRRALIDRALFGLREAA